MNPQSTPQYSYYCRQTNHHLRNCQLKAKDFISEALCKIKKVYTRGENSCMPKAAQPRVGLGGCSPRKSVVNLGSQKCNFQLFCRIFSINWYAVKIVERLFFSSTSVRAALWNNKTKEILCAYYMWTLRSCINYISFRKVRITFPDKQQTSDSSWCFLKQNDQP